MNKLLLSFSVSVIAIVLAPAISLANHAKVNCGPYGFWDNSYTGDVQGSFVWLMNDDLVKIQAPGKNDWVDFGTVKYNSTTSVDDVALSDYAAGGKFVGANFQMVLDEEFSRPKQKKDRRFFRASFTATPAKGRALSGKLECAVGLK